MKKLALTFGVVGLLTIGLSSCNKCSECSDSDQSALNTEYCDFDDAEEEITKELCEASNGTWTSK